MDLLISKKTLSAVNHYIESPSQAMILTGPNGIGKYSLSIYLASKLLNTPSNKILNNPNLKVIKPFNNSIGIEEVRNLDHFLSLKSVSKKQINRLVIIDESQNLTIEAQNALLKMLEEPPKGTIFILNASNLSALLPTIRSRCQTLNIIKPDRKSIEKYYIDSGYNKELIDKAINISGGLPGLITAILNNTDHPLIEATNVARDLLSKELYEKLILVDLLVKDKELTVNTIYILKQMAHVGLNNNKDSYKWIKILRASYDAEESIKKNSQLKLTLDKLILSI